MTPCVLAMFTTTKVTIGGFYGVRLRGNPVMMLVASVLQYSGASDLLIVLEISVNCSDGYTNLLVVRRNAGEFVLLKVYSWLPLGL